MAVSAGRRHARAKRADVQRAREEAVLMMYARGMTQSEIAGALDLRQPTISVLLSKALIRRANEDPVTGAKARALLTERWEALIRAWMPLALGTDTDPPNEKAADVVLRTLDRLAKIAGLDVAPTIQQNVIMLSPDELRQKIMGSLDEAAARADLVQGILTRGEDPPEA